MKLNLLRTMLAMEDTYFGMAAKSNHSNCLVICDRGAMDASAYVDAAQWQELLAQLGTDELQINED